MQRIFIIYTMTTYREIVSMCLDELKLISDDSHFVEEHVIFLADKYRAFLLAQRYRDIKKEIPDSNYQTICIDLQPYNPFGDIACAGQSYLKSVQEVPYMMEVGSQKITSADFFQGDFAYIDNERFKYVGNNKFLKNQIYSTIAPDKHLYMKSNNPQIFYLQKAKVTGIFEDSSKASELNKCPEEETACDVMDMRFPLEESLIPPLIELIVKELGGQKYQSEDNENNAKDDLSDLAAYIRQQIANGRRSDLYKDYS